MQTYNIQPRAVKIADREVSVVNLGETGRGRKQVSVLCDFTEGDEVEVKLPKPGMPGKTRIVKADKSSDGLVMRISTEGAYVRGAMGWVGVNDPEAVELVASGYGAFGDAGRTGTWDDILIAVKKGCVLRVKPSRGDAYFLYIDNNFKVSKVSNDELGFLIEGLEGFVVNDEGVILKESFTRLQ